MRTFEQCCVLSKLATILCCSGKLLAYCNVIFVCRLVCDSQNRLGYDVDDLKNHCFFRGTDWEHIRDRPSAIPINVKHMADTSNFDDFEELDEQKRCKY